MSINPEQSPREEAVTLSLNFFLMYFLDLSSISFINLFLQRSNNYAILVFSKVMYQQLRCNTIISKRNYYQYNCYWIFTGIGSGCKSVEETLHSVEIALQVEELTKAIFWHDGALLKFQL